MILISAGVHRCSRAMLLGVLFACSSTPEHELSLDALKKDEGLVVFQLQSSGMAQDPEAIWGIDFRLHFRPLSDGPIRAWLSSSRVRRNYLNVKASEKAKFVTLKLPGGSYVFHSLISSMQEAALEIRFDVLPDELTYIGSLRIDVTNLREDILGLTRIERVDTRVGWEPDLARQILGRRYPDGYPEMKERQAKEFLGRGRRR